MNLLMQKKYCRIGLKNMIQIEQMIESLLLTVLICTCIHVTITDIRYGVIRNRVIAIAGIVSLALNVIYYLMFATEYTVPFLVNEGVIIIIAIAFYALNIWAGGDSKLLILTVSLIPARIYCDNASGVVAVNMIIIIFAIAYLYMLGESIYLGIKDKSILKHRKITFDFKRMIYQYVRCISFVTIFSVLIESLFPVFYANNHLLVMILNMIIILVGYRLEVLNNIIPVVVIAVIAVVVYLIAGTKGGFGINPSIYILVIIVFVLRLVMEKYNYETISTKDVKAGMVLSYATIVSFIPSRIRGLPRSTTEDIRSRITEEEAKSIRRWESSKYGSGEIIIVRKIPFAIFISIGVVGYSAFKLLVI